MDTGPKKPKAKQSIVELAQARLATYKQLLPLVKDDYGFVESDKCDSLLFTGLLRAVYPDDSNMKAAQGKPGEWFRRPLVNGHDTCYADGNSGSTISRDMLMGLFWYIWRNKRLDMAQDLWNYGKAHNWIMGSGEISRTLMTPGLKATLAEIIYQLGGDNHIISRSVPQAYSLSSTGFPVHLDMLHIGIRAELTGTIDDLVVIGTPEPIEVLTHHYKRSPNNAMISYLYHKYVDGNYTKALSLALNPSWFPADRLPNRGDRKEPFLWQRDYGPDYLPDPNPATHSHEHSGADYIFVVSLILQELNAL